MIKPTQLRSLYTRTGASTVDTVPGHGEHDNGDNDNSAKHDNHPRRFPPPSIFQRAQLKGVLQHPSDIIFLFRMAFAMIWAMIRLHCIEFPYHILTKFRYSTKQHPVEWPWRSSVFFAPMRAGAATIHSMPQMRFVGQLINMSLPWQMLFMDKIKVTKDVQFKINLDVLLRPEHATLAEVREDLRRRGFSDDPLNPSLEYLESMHPHGTNAHVANLPEEVGNLDADGTYTLKGEWIEALDDPKHPDSRPRSKTVVLYFHGGAHVFCSPKSHRHMLSQLAKDIGPGTRVFSVDYRLAPENPFPAAIHDAFAAYLYLTEPEHAALVLDERSAVHELAVDPRDIVVAGDSAGGNLAAAFMLYMARYVQPSTEPKVVLPHATILLSAWADVTSSLPAAKSLDRYCYCPGPIGTSPFDRSTFLDSCKQNCGSQYTCGDVNLTPNIRNALGEDRRWDWYSHLSQHPLASPAHATQGFLKGITNTLLQTASHDRLVDDSRLYAHRLGPQNPGRITRIEVYRDMVHVHQMLVLFFQSARIATKNIARFIERSQHMRGDEEHKAQKMATAVSGERSYAAVLRKVPIRDQSKPGDKQQQKHGSVKAQHYHHHHQNNEHGSGEEEYVPAYLLPLMVKEKAADGVEWVMVDQDGSESAGDEGLPSLETLTNVWVPHTYVKEE